MLERLLFYFITLETYCARCMVSETNESSFSENIYPYCLWLWRSNGWLWYADYSLMYDKWCHAHFLHTKINHCLGQNQMQWNIGMFFTQKRLKSFQDCKGWAILTTAALTNLQNEASAFASKTLLEKNTTMTKINRMYIKKASASFGPLLDLN